MKDEKKWNGFSDDNNENEQECEEWSDYIKISSSYRKNVYINMY